MLNYTSRTSFNLLAIQRRITDCNKTVFAKLEHRKRIVHRTSTMCIVRIITHTANHQLLTCDLSGECHAWVSRKPPRCSMFHHREKNVAALSLSESTRGWNTVMLCEQTFLARCNCKAKLLQVRPNIIKFSYLYVPCKIRFTGPTEGHSMRTFVENALSHATSVHISASTTMQSSWGVMLPVLRNALCMLEPKGKTKNQVRVVFGNRLKSDQFNSHPLSCRHS